MSPSRALHSHIGLSFKQISLRNLRALYLASRRFRPSNSDLLPHSLRGRTLAGSDRVPNGDKSCVGSVPLYMSA